MHSSRRLVPLVSFAFFIALAGCGGNAVAPVASSVPQVAGGMASAIVSRTEAAAVSAVAAQPAIDETSLTAADEPIPGAAPPDVAGTYSGSLQDRVPQYQAVDRGMITFTIRQSGSSVSGSIAGQSNQQQSPHVLYRFTGSASSTPKGAVLYLTITNSNGEKDGMWAKIVGSTLFGKGWVDPNGTGDPYEQLIFAAHKT